MGHKNPGFAWTLWQTRVVDLSPLSPIISAVASVASFLFLFRIELETTLKQHKTQETTNRWDRVRNHIARLPRRSLEGVKKGEIPSDSKCRSRAY